MMSENKTEYMTKEEYLQQVADNQVALSPESLAILEGDPSSMLEITEDDLLPEEWEAFIKE